MKRWFTLLLVLALCCAPIFGGLTALADEELPVEAEATAPGEVEVELGYEAVDAEVPEEAETPRDLTPEPSMPVYVKVLAQTLDVYAGIDGAVPFAALALNDVVLATAQAEPGQRQAIAFNTARGIVEGYADAEALQALTFGELNDYVVAFADNVPALYNDDVDYPLATLACRFADEAQPGEAPPEAETPAEQPAEEAPAAEAEQPEEEAPAAEAEQPAEPEAPPAEAEQPAEEAPATEPAEPAQEAEAEPSEAPASEGEPAAEPSAEAAEPEQATGEPAEDLVPVATEEPVESDGGEYAVAAAGDPVALADFALPPTLTLGVKETYVMTPALAPANAAATFAWRTSKPKIVDVDPASGTLVAKKKGTAIITATSSTGLERSCTVTVMKAPKAITLPESRIVLMGGGQTYQLVPTLTKKTGAVIYFESDNPGVAAVGPSGLITTVAPGTCNVVARIFTGKYAVCTVVVLDPSLPQPARIDIPATLTIGVKQVALITPVMYTSSGESLGTTEFTLESSAPKKLKVNPDGTVTGVKKGDYTLKITAYNGVSATCQVHVDKAPSKVAITPAQPVIGVGQTRQLGYTFPKGGVGTVTFSGNNPGVLAVDASGIVTGVAEGTAVVTARTHNGKTAKATVKVSKSPEYVGLNAEYGLEYDQLANSYTTVYNVALNPGETFQLSCEVEYGAYGDVASFETRDTSVATVSASGLISAVGPGATILVVRTTGGSETYCRVRVSGGEPSPFWFDAAELTLRVGETVAVPSLSSSSLEAERLATATYSSGNPGAFSVAYSEANGRWEVTGLNSDIGTIGATVDETTVRLNVTVLPAVPVATTPTYRLFAAYSYFNPDYKGYIPFTENNATSTAAVFGNSNISGLTYATKVMGNPTKTRLLSGISSFFAGTADVDVSIVYLCSHGHMTNGYAGYRMSLPGYDDSPDNANYFLSSQEILNCVKRIRGNVVLIVDSCYSGAFLQDMSGQLDAMGGRIAVLTAASDTRATYYNVKKTEKTVDFFTFFLLKGLGYNHRDKWWNSNAAGKKGVYPGYLAADQAGNQDGIVTLGEFFNYAAQSIATNIPGYMKKSWYWGDKTRVQVPRFYPGALNDLVIYVPR